MHHVEPSVEKRRFAEENERLTRNQSPEHVFYAFEKYKFHGCRPIADDDGQPADRARLARIQVDLFPRLVEHCRRNHLRHNLHISVAGLNLGYRPDGVSVNVFVRV